jgi:hypothetical protein
LLYFEGYFEFFALFKNFYLFNPPLLAEPTTMFCGTVRLGNTAIREVK